MLERMARLGLVAAGGYAALSFLAHRSIYYPMRYPEGWWNEQRSLGAEDVQIVTRDGVKLHGWWKETRGSEIATLFLHGNAGNVSHRGRSIRAITEAGSSVLALDYRGYGKSEGSPSETGLYADADAAYDWLIGKGYDAARLILHGESLGTAVAVELASRRSSRGLILEAPFPSARAVAGTVLPVVGPALVWGFDSKG
ncbi:MAG: alpha/beta fold hydrolase, partial [Bryobacterales bacterium]|nr:alpha/beta fold hydrolase [Bryobacterales bacterium]